MYRLFLPHLSTPNSKFVFHAKQTPVKELAASDVVVVQRQCTRGNMMALKQMQEMGIKVVYDLDDDLWSIPGSSPAKKIFAPVREGFGACMECCDAVTVSTEHLKSAVNTSVPLARGKIIEVIPNAMDFNYMVPPPIPRSSDKVVVGWGGSNTHQGDVRDVWMVLPELLRDLPQLYLEFIGMNPPKSLVGHSRVKMKPYVPIGEFAARYPSNGWDIILAPLDECRFNNSKSNIKFLEAAAIGSVCLGSPVGPYREFCSKSPDLNWLLCNSPTAWKEKIRALVLDAELRARMARETRIVAEAHYNQINMSKKWMRLFQRLVA